MPKHIKSPFLFCYAKLMKILVLLRRNILGQNNYSEAKEAFLLLL
ncbi:MAG: hypothetical protein ABIC18_02920 [Candidatus Omnitrophota bacterium]